MQPKKSKKIAIVFGDNDFVNTFMPIMEILSDAWAHSEPKFFDDKKKVCEAINLISEGCYLLFQKGDYTERDEHIREYLKVHPGNVLLNEEVDDYIYRNMKTNNFNNSTFIVDLNESYVYCL